MSLTGSLEDLPLLDIIQIVSFSKKTGYLAIRVESQDAAIVFHEGLVVCSYTWDSLPLDARAAALSSTAREGMIRKRIEIALEQLIRLRDGEFNFSLTELMPTQVGARDIRPETLAQGINPQELLLDLARGMDEDRRDSSAVLEASFASPDEAFDDDLSSVSSFVRSAETIEEQTDERSYTIPLPAVSAEAPAPGAMRDLLELPVPVPIPEASGSQASVAAAGPPARRVMLVDDEADVRGILARHLVAGGYEVHEAESPDDAVRLAGRMVKAGTGDFLLVTDLGMPASGGASFQGGFEVVKRLWKMNLKPAVLMMTESLGTTLRARAKQMGVTHFVFKPGLSKLDPEQFEADLEAFAARLVNDLLPVMQQLRTPLAAKPAARPRSGTPEPVPNVAPASDETSRQMRALQQHLDELRQRGDAAQISLLIMKVAREFFERSVLFLVKNDELRGLGGFGPAPREENLNLLARDVVIPLNEPTIFQRVVNGCKPWSGELPDGKGSGQLMVKIGRFKSSRVALLPLLTHRQTTALLFGDNPETGRELERLEVLEVFLDQAGVALENVFLQRKLQSLEA